MDEKATRILGGLYQDVNHYGQRINYQATVSPDGCNYEFLINDYPVDRYFGPDEGSASGSIPINIAILKPGTQTWKIKIYPLRDRKEVNGKVTLVPQQSIRPDAKIKVAIEGIRFGENGNIEKRFGKALDFETDLKKGESTGQQVSSGTGKPYIEYSGTFEAAVPYQMDGWEKSQDISKMDTIALKKQLLAAYQQYHDWLQQRKLDEIAQQKLPAEKEMAQAFFYDKKTNENFLATFLQRWGQKNLEMQPLENYKVAVYGNGKIVTLIDVVDGSSPLWGNYKTDQNRYKHHTYLIYFHLPAGKKELEVIR
ncbi:hypothetical protein D3C87_782790 [compost metagenome]